MIKIHINLELVSKYRFKTLGNCCPSFSSFYISRESEYLSVYQSEDMSNSSSLVFDLCLPYSLKNLLAF